MRESYSSKFDPKINLLSCVSVYQYHYVLYMASDYYSLAVSLKMNSWFHTDWWISHASPERVTDFTSINPPCCFCDMLCSGGA